MRIRTSINHRYSIIALRRKKRILVAAAIALACVALTNLAIDAGIVSNDSGPTMASRMLLLRPGDALTASSANARLRPILGDRTDYAGSARNTPGTASRPGLHQAGPGGATGAADADATGNIEKLSPLSRR